MKRICISVNEKTLLKIKEAVKNHVFRSNSHAFEAAVNKVIGE